MDPDTRARYQAQIDQTVTGVLNNNDAVEAATDSLQIAVQQTYRTLRASGVKPIEAAGMVGGLITSLLFFMGEEEGRTDA